MPAELKGILTPGWFEEVYQRNRELLGASDSPGVAGLRDQAMETFLRLGFPHTGLENWRHTDLSASLNKAYDILLTRPEDTDPHDILRCNIPHLDTAVIGQLNGFFISKDVPLMELGNGIIMGSLAEAMKKYPALVDRYFGKTALFEKDALTALNTAFAQDGVFIYVPDHVKSPRPVQIINVINNSGNVFLQSRNLIVLGKNAHLSLVHCDDSYNHETSFSNIVTEIHIGDNSYMDHYKLQNINNNSTLISQVAFHLESEANLESHFVQLNGGLMRNNTSLRFNGPGGNANMFGIYLLDRKQHADHHVFVDHAYPNCTSNELFKGILDEHARGVFNGHVLVRSGASGTDARQGNKNILLTDTARINSKPFLEIYNDDVKCSHGSTTGQLDAESMFYLRQRGIGEESARMLLMFAFADEVVSKIAIPQLRQRIEDMVKKRLQGELQICEHCVLHCSIPEHPVEFAIDLSKL